MISFRPMERADLPDVLRWRQAPHARRWFSGDPQDLRSAEAEYAPCLDGTEPTHLHVVEIDGTGVGYMQHYLVSDYPEYLAAVREERAAAIDFLIGEKEYVGKGLGPKIIRQYIEQIVVPNSPAISRVVSSPDPENARSIRALEKAGFSQRETIDVDGRPERLCLFDL